MKEDPELVTERDELGNTALLLAAEHSIPAVKVLLEHGGANVLETNDTAQFSHSLEYCLAA